MRIVVVGGSLGGLSAALWLGEARHEVEVFERSPVPLEGRGAGIVLNPATVRFLTERRSLDVGGLSVGARRLRYLAADGSVAAETPCSYRFTSYTSLYERLLAAFGSRRYQLGRECVEVRQDGDAVEGRFADGSSVAGDVLVAADGVNSAVRRQLVPDVAPRYAGYVAWRGTIGETQLGEEASAVLGEAITYRVMRDSHLLVYPIPRADGGDGGGGRLTNWLWYRNVPDGPRLDDVLTGKDGVRFGSSLPPGMVRDEQLARLRDDAHAELPRMLADMVAATRDPFLQVVLDLEVPRMAVDRIAIVGDAAFALRPHVAAGSAKAAEDGRTLARALDGAGADPVAALESWQEDQLALGRRAVARARDAGARLQTGRWPVGDPLPFGLREAGDSTMTVPGD